MIELPQDFRDLLVELANAGADFVVVGGHAVAFHGHPRATKDLDVLVRANPGNAVRVFQALAAFGAPLQSFEVSEADFATYDGVLQLGIPPRRIDVLNRATGITFDEAVADGQTRMRCRPVISASVYPRRSAVTRLANEVREPASMSQTPSLVVSSTMVATVLRASGEKGRHGARSGC
jgi:hypothetical protein